MLTPNREAFAVGLAEGLTQAAAYRRAFPRSVNWQDATVWRRASEMAGDGEVQGRVRELAAKTARASEVKLEQIAAELARLSFFAVRKARAEKGSMVAAVLGVTESRVCQLHSQSIARLRVKLREW